MYTAKGERQGQLPGVRADDAPRGGRAARAARRSAARARERASSRCTTSRDPPLRAAPSYGVEALLRWHHPDPRHRPADPVHPARRGHRPDHPDRALGARTRPVTRAALLHERFAAQPPLDISVNLSVRSCSPTTIVEDVGDALARPGSSPARSCSRSPRAVLMADSSDRAVRAPERAQGARHPARDRRLRHRLLVALLPQPVRRSTSSRSTSRSSTARRDGRLRALLGRDRRPRRDARPRGRRRGHRAVDPGVASARAGLRARPGLPLRPRHGAGRRHALPERCPGLGRGRASGRCSIVTTASTARAASPG